VIEASVRERHDGLGWGVLDPAETPGGCWVHFSNIPGRERGPSAERGAGEEHRSRLNIEWDND